MNFYPQAPHLLSDFGGD